MRVQNAERGKRILIFASCRSAMITEAIYEFDRLPLSWCCSPNPMEGLAVLVTRPPLLEPVAVRPHPARWVAAQADLCHDAFTSDVD
jgi:hypothetical protein